MDIYKRIRLLFALCFSLLLCGAFSAPSHAEVIDYEIIKSDESDFIPYTPAPKPDYADDKKITQEQIDKLEENGWIYAGQNEETGVYEFLEAPKLSLFSTKVEYIPESSMNFTIIANCDGAYVSYKSTSGIATIPANTFDSLVIDYFKIDECSFDNNSLPAGTRLLTFQLGFAMQIGTITYHLEYDGFNNTANLIPENGNSVSYSVYCNIPATDSNRVGQWKTRDQMDGDQTSQPTQYFSMDEEVECYSPDAGSVGCQVYPYDFVLTVDVDENYQSSQDLADVKDSIDKQTDVIEENHEETKGLLGTIIDGITSLPSKLWEIVSNGLKALFIPKDGWFMEQIRALNDDLSESFGFLWAPFDYAFQFIDDFMSTAGGGVKDTFRIDIPAIGFEMNGQKMIIVDAFTFDFKESVKNNEQVYELVDIMRTCIDFVFVILIFVMGSQVVYQWFGFKTAIDWTDALFTNMHTTPRDGYDGRGMYIEDRSFVLHGKPYNKDDIGRRYY